MLPVILLAGAALFLVAISKSKTDPQTGAVDPDTCLPLVAKKMASSMGTSFTHEQLATYANMARDKGYDSLAACIEAVAAGGTQGCPELEPLFLGEIKGWSVNAVKFLAAGMRAKGWSDEAACLDAYVKTLEAPEIPASAPPEPGSPGGGILL